MAYYNIEEYPIIPGNPDSGIAVCIGWQDATTLTNTYPMLTDKCAIIGSLYLAQGINAMIRNLALNPGIRILYLWRHDDNSLSQQGIYATNALLKLWREGVDELHMCDDFTLEKEIPVAVFDTIRSSVEICVIDEVPPGKLLEKIRPLAANPYMEARSFPDPVYETPTLFPSEKAGFVVHSKTIYDAWLELLFHIDRFGELYEGGGMHTRRVLAITWVAESESGNFPISANMPETLQRKLCITPEQILEYAKDHFLGYGKADSDSYTYGNRMHRWTGHFDQIEAVTSLLHKNLATRQAYVSISVPDRDLSGSIRSRPVWSAYNFYKTAMR